MKLSILLAALLITSSLFPSCKDKDKDETPAPVTYPNYSQLKVGNYWIYQDYYINNNGEENLLPKYDSCFVQKDTLINNRTYYKVYQIYPYSQKYSPIFLRDSLNYIVNHRGRKLFSSQDFTNVLNTRYLTNPPANDTIAKLMLKMADKDFTAQVPAGVFQTINARTTYHYYPSFGPPDSVRHFDTRYAQNIGIVQETFTGSSSGNDYWERRLVRYHVQP